MSVNSINAFISELVRAANEVAEVGDYERSRLLDRAARTVRELRIESGIHTSGPGTDRLRDLVAASRTTPIYSDREIATYLLDGAGMIRDLHIVLNSKTEIRITDPPLAAG